MKFLKFSKRNSSDNHPEEKSYSFSNFLAGKNVLITGAGRNIGRSIALEMAQNGANIFFTDIDHGRSKKLKKELEEYPVTSSEFISDISKIKDIELLCNSLSKNKISIDVLVNNSGIGIAGNTDKDHDPGNWNTLFNTNVIGPVHLTKLISQQMINEHISGSILFITSVHQWMVSLNKEYSASKAALGMIIKELAVELAPYKIRVNGIAPGYIREDEDGKTFPHRYTPLYATSINPCYIGRAAVYLSSEYFSKFTTGTILKIDSGLSLYNHLVDKNIQK